MSARESSPSRNALLAAGAVAGVAGAGIAAGRGAVALFKRKSDPKAGMAYVIEHDREVTVPGHDGAFLHTVSRGEGPQFLLAHGLAHEKRTWAAQFDTFPKEGVEVVAFDHRGHGKSTIGTDGHSIVNLAEDVKSVIEHLNLRDILLVGHSMGGIAVQSFITRYPEFAEERVKGVVLISTVCRTVSSQLGPFTKLAEKAAVAFPNMAKLVEADTMGFLMVRFGLGHSPSTRNVELTREMILNCPYPTIRDAGRALLGLDLTEELRKVKIPTLVIGGTADVLTPPGESRRIARTIPGARLIMIKGGGHMLMLEQTDEINQAIRDFAVEVGVTAAG